MAQSEIGSRTGYHGRELRDLMREYTQNNRREEIAKFLAGQNAGVLETNRMIVFCAKMMREFEYDPVSHIRKAYAFNAAARKMASCNHPYMGSMAQHTLTRLTGVAAPYRLWDLENQPATAILKGAMYLQDNGFPWSRVKHVLLEEEMETGFKPSPENQDEERPRVRSNGKQVLLDDKHLADAKSEAAAEAIALALLHFGETSHQIPATTRTKIMRILV